MTGRLRPLAMALAAVVLALLPVLGTGSALAAARPATPGQMAAVAGSATSVPDARLVGSGAPRVQHASIPLAVTEFACAGVALLLLGVARQGVGWRLISAAGPFRAVRGPPASAVC